MNKVYLLVQQYDCYAPIHSLSSSTLKLFNTEKEALKEKEDNHTDYAGVFELNLEEMTAKHMYKGGL